MAEQNRGEGRLIKRALFFFGWILSPFTFWNDAFVNIPLAYLVANLTAHLFRIQFLTLVVIYYWLTNVVGVILMWDGLKGVEKDRRSIIREASIFLAAIVIYSVILVALGRFGILRPLAVVGKA